MQTLCYAEKVKHSTQIPNKKKIGLLVNFALCVELVAKFKLNNMLDLIDC